MDRDWGLCVGIGSYPNGSGLGDLPGALNDARAIHTWLVDTQKGNVPAQQCQLILSTAPQADPPHPNPDGIERFLRKLYQLAAQNQLAGKGFKVGRRLWLYYSGHGMGFGADDDTGLLTADTLLPFDLPHVPGLAWANLFQASAAFEEVVLFMDCCRTLAVHTPLRRPSLRQVVFHTPGKRAAAFAVSESRAAMEIQVDGLPRGAFTRALEGLLELPRLAPVTARGFLNELELAYPQLDPKPPLSAQQDFILLEANIQAPPDSLIVHGETTGGLAVSLAQKMSGPQRATDSRWFGQVLASPPAAREYKHVRNLIVVRDMAGDQLRDLVKVVKPTKTVIYGQTDPGLDDLPNVSFVHRGPAEDVDINEAAIKVETALAKSRGSLSIVSGVGLAKLQLWDRSGRALDQSYGSMELAELPVGSYRLHASLGSLLQVFKLKIESNKSTVLEVDLLKGFKVKSKPLKTVDKSPAPNERSHYTLTLHDTRARISAPPANCWRMEHSEARIGKQKIESLRLVPANAPPGEPHPADGIRTCLRLAVAAPVWPAEPPPVEDLHGDPVSLLLAAALRLRNRRDPDAYLSTASALLGADDPDVQLLRGSAMLSEPPLLSFGWFHRLKRDELSVVKDSTADGLVGNLLASDPWLAWTEDPSKGSNWLRQVANATWPGWDVEPELAMSAQRLDEAAPALGAPVGSVQRRNYKSPPIHRLKRHERIAFLGASNDQLPAALAVAFVERGHRKWQKLDVWSLTDAPLSKVKSAGRSGAALLAGRNEAEESLRRLLTVVAEDWTMQRYDGLQLNGTPLFASLWDWEHKGGYVHASPAKLGEEVRTASYDDLDWQGPEPPLLYRQVVDAYRALTPLVLDS